MVRTPGSTEIVRSVQCDNENLKSKRHYNELSLYAMYKRGVIHKDKGGYFTYEQIVSPLGEEECGEKFYIEESYQYIESNIASYIELANQIQSSMDADNVRKMQASALHLVALDYRVDVLLRLLQQPELLSVSQIDERMDDNMSLGAFSDYMAEPDSSPMNFASSMFQMLDFALRAPSNASEKAEEENNQQWKTTESKQA